MFIVFSLTNACIAFGKAVFIIESDLHVFFKFAVGCVRSHFVLRLAFQVSSHSPCFYILAYPIDHDGDASSSCL